MTALPTRKLEAFRYADIDALASVWSDACAARTDRNCCAAKCCSKSGCRATRRAGSPRRNRRSKRARVAQHFRAQHCAALRPHRARRDASPKARDFELRRGQHRRRQFDARNRHHRAPPRPAATSRQTVRSVLGGKAAGSYLGKVAVARDAQQTDSEQSVKAMLLDRGATANCQARARNLRRRRQMRAWRDGRRTRRERSCSTPPRAGSIRRAARALLLEGFVGGLWDDIDGDDQRHRRRRARRAERRSHERRSPASIRALDVRDQFPAIPPAGIISTAPRPRRSRRR